MRRTVFTRPLFSKNSSLRSRQTRQDDRFYLPRIRSEAGRRQFAYRAPQLYNKLAQSGCARLRVRTRRPSAALLPLSPPAFPCVSSE